MFVPSPLRGSHGGLRRTDSPLTRRVGIDDINTGPSTPTVEKGSGEVGGKQTILTDEERPDKDAQTIRAAFLSIGFVGILGVFQYIGAFTIGFKDASTGFIANIPVGLLACVAVLLGVVYWSLSSATKVGSDEKVDWINDNRDTWTPPRVKSEEEESEEKKK